MIGRSITRRTLAIGGLTAGAGAYGMMSGIGSKNVTDNLLQMTTGDAQFDQYAIGTDMGARDVFLPGPLNVFRRGVGGVEARTQGGAIAGGAVGGAVGALAASGRGRIGWGIAGAVAGTIGGGAAGFASASQGVINPTTISDSMRARQYDNQLPYVSGDMVFGMFNSRMGGY